jgi:hypothetical protein
MASLEESNGLTDKIALLIMPEAWVILLKTTNRREGAMSASDDYQAMAAQCFWQAREAEGEQWYELARIWP